VMRVSAPARQGVFVSYARSDGEAIARALHERLASEAPDIEAWLDRYEIEGGVGWWKQIDQELDRAEFLLLVMTPAAIDSENTRREWRSARQRGVCVYPVKAAADAALDFAQLPSWMRKAHFYDLALEWPKLIAHLRRGCQATHVPFMAPPLPARHVARDDVSATLTDWLLAPDRAGAIALRGAGGFGKTTLATALCHDERVIEAFDDGILWVTLGQSPNLLNETVKVFAALTGERPGFIDEDDAARELAGKLADKNCLIVIDDAWHAGHARRFLLGGPGCAHLVTTRLTEVAPDARTVDVDRMTAAQALELLAARSGADDLDAASSLQLVTRLGRWPLAVKLAGSAMRQRSQRGDSTAKALDYVKRALDKRGITAFDRSDTDERSDAVALTIGASLDLLDAVERRRCIELAVFPEDKAIPLQAVAHLWRCDDLDGEDLARRLDELALVELDLRQGHLRMHDTLRAFMAAQLGDPALVHAGLIDAWGEPHALPYPYAWRNYAHHMRWAGRGTAMHALLLDGRWLSAKLEATDIHAVIGDFESAEASAALATVRDALRLSAPALAIDARQWRAQLQGRLLGRHEPELAGFLGSLENANPGPWLQLLHPSLDVPGGMLRMTLDAHLRGVTSLASDGRQERLVSGSADGRVKVWDCVSGRLLAALPDRGLDVTAVAMSADGRRVLSGGADGLMELWDLEQDQRLHKFSAPERRGIRAIAMSADASLAVSSSRDAELLVWDLGNPRIRHPLRGHSESVTSVALSADGALAVSGSDDGTVRLWDTKTAASLHTLRGHDASVNAVAVSGDGTRVLS
ncbi:MAG TPA: NB-ARC domain-containing protein, partial [Caldimonas sp.]